MADDRRKKIFLMRISIAVFMVLLFSVWVFNLKNVWVGEQRFSSATNNDTSWQNLKADLSQILTDTKSQLKEIERIRAEKKKGEATALVNSLLSEVGELSATSSIATGTDLLATTTPPTN